jgi:hypothetical protein
MKELKTTVLIKLSIDACHNFPLAADLFPEVDFLADRHRHMFHFKIECYVSHDDRQIEFLMLKRDILDYLLETYYDYGTRTHEFGARSCEMLATEILNYFSAKRVEVWEDDENGAAVEIV